MRTTVLSLALLAATPALAQERQPTPPPAPPAPEAARTADETPAPLRAERISTPRRSCGTPVS